MKTLTICLLAFCVVTVCSYRPSRFHYSEQKWFPRCVYFKPLQWRLEHGRSKVDVKTKDNVIPPEVEITPRHEDVIDKREPVATKNLLKNMIAVLPTMMQRCDYDSDSDEE